MEASRGTTIVAILSSHGAYLACDSRSTNPSSDDVQKIFKCVSSGFIAITGMIRLSGWKKAADSDRIDHFLDPMQLLDNASSACVAEGDQLVQYIDNAMWEPLWDFWQNIVMPSPADMIAQAKDSLVFQLAGIANFDGALRAFQIDYRIQPSGQLAPSTARYRNDPIFSWGQTVAWEGEPPDLSESDGVVNAISKIYRIAFGLHPSVGGPIDIGFLSKGDGATWIVRKHLDEPNVGLNENPEA